MSNKPLSLCTQLTYAQSHDVTRFEIHLGILTHANPRRRSSVIPPNFPAEDVRAISGAAISPRKVNLAGEWCHRGLAAWRYATALDKVCALTTFRLDPY